MENFHVLLGYEKVQSKWNSVETNVYHAFETSWKKQSNMNKEQ